MELRLRFDSDQSTFYILIILLSPVVFLAGVQLIDSRIVAANFSSNPCMIVSTFVNAKLTLSSDTFTLVPSRLVEVVTFIISFEGDGMYFVHEVRTGTSSSQRVVSKVFEDGSRTDKGGRIRRVSMVRTSSIA